MPTDIDALVLSNDRLSDSYNVIKLSAPDIARTTKPGQFVMVRKNHDLTALLRRPFSVFETLFDSQEEPVGFSILNKRIGVVTNTLFNLVAGDRLQCLGPLGQPFTIPPKLSSALMIAGGVGLAPFASLAQSLKTFSIPTHLLYGGRSSSDLYYIDWFERLGVRVVLTTEDGSRGNKGLVTSSLQHELKTQGENELKIYACGPTLMMREVATIGTEYGYSTEVSLEPVMGCGLGGCYSCVVSVKGNAEDESDHLVRSCLHGPVFPGNKVNWNLLT
tara:strand:+ start:799 stop:1623 length:825 start_codon:yes stop_codon:yes gene_type:complete